MDQRVKAPPSAGPPIWVHDERSLAYSWLLVLLAAPIIIALLVWFRVLLRRRDELTRSRLRQDSGLVSYSYTGSSSAPKPGDRSSWPAKESRSTSYQLGNPASSTRGKFDAPVNFNVQNQSLKSLVNHTSLYLASLAWQQIFACCMALLMAVLNLLRARNLLACNLVIFPLMSGKLLNLFALTAFSVIRLAKLVNMRRYANKPPSYCSSSTNDDMRSSSNRVTSDTNSSTYNSSSVGQDELSTRDLACQQEARLCESTTTHRLIVSDANSAKRARASRRSCTTTKTKTARPASSNRWQICQSWMLILLSVGLAAVYLYLRLMNMVLVEGGSGGEQAVQAPDNKTSAVHLRDTWQISHGQVTTGYYSAEPSQLVSQSGRASKPGYLRQLANQYELESFMRLLLSRQFVTSRFTCTLAAANYVPAARISAMLLYASLMLIVLMASMASQCLSRAVLRHFVPNSGGGGGGLGSWQARAADLGGFWLAGSQESGASAAYPREPRRRRATGARLLGHHTAPPVGLTSTCSSSCSRCSDEFRPASQPQFRAGRLALVGGAASIASLSSFGAASTEAARSAGWKDVELGADKASLATSNSSTRAAHKLNQETHQASTDKVRPTGAPPWSAASVSQPDLSTTFGWLMYAELRRDLKLSQSVILFGQLLDHAPVLVSS